MIRIDVRNALFPQNSTRHDSLAMIFGNGDAFCTMIERSFRFLRHIKQGQPGNIMAGEIGFDE
ncbi:MAG: hypothetical protein KKH12_06730 [Gammaproteobacteria bacterium]|nr:hypothetical protein [Gammaproteobacteria bacterium]MBU1481354.1 hypothetical protein [Gammaproteobacteria bacterium]